MSEENIIHLRSPLSKDAHCDTCSLSGLCLPLSLGKEGVKRLDDIIRRSRPIEKGETLFKQGDPVSSIYAIRSGAVKTYTVAMDGKEQIIGFHLASELVGFSGYNHSTYPLTAKSLQTTSICEIPIDRLESLSSEMPELRQQIMRFMSDEIRQDQQMMLLLSQKNAEEKVASFLTDLSTRFHRRGYSATVFRLSMSRVDIANYLGLAVETVSRVFTRFQKNGVIGTNGKEVRINNQRELFDIAGIAWDETESQELS